MKKKGWNVRKEGTERKREGGGREKGEKDVKEGRKEGVSRQKGRKEGRKERM